MALVVYDRVQQTGTANTTVSFTLTGSVTGYQSFAVVGNGNTTFYAATDATGNWEVGVGTYATGGTLTRTTILSSSNSGSAVTFSGTVNVFVTYPSEKSVNLDASGNVTALGTITSGVWNGTTIPVGYGGTGVTTSSGANSVVLRDANQNVTANNFLAGYNVITAAGTTTTLTVASAYYQRISGSTTQTIKLPDATTLVNGQGFTFDNDSSGAVSIIDNASGAVDTVPSGGYSYIFVENNSTSAGSWGKYALIPASYDFSTTTADFGTATIINTTYNGNTVGTGYGGTGLTTFTGANNALYSTSSSALTAGTLPVAAGGTGVTASTGASSVMLRDANQNTTINNIAFGTTTTATAGGTTVLTVASSAVQNFTGSLSQNLNLPDATTLTLGAIYYINNNSAGSVVINNNGGTPLYTVARGGATQLTLITNTTANGTWQQSAFVPNNVFWGSVALQATSTQAQFSSLTLGTALAVAYGGTGLTSPGTSGNVLTSNGTTWVSSPVSATPAGSNTQVQYNNSGAFGASSSFTYASSTLTAPYVSASGGFILNALTISTSYTIPSGSSAMSTGPLTFSAGVAITVPAGSRWVVL